MTAVPTRTLIQSAYGVRAFQITGEPSWVNDERYDIDAKAERITSSDQARSMLQALLADRFKLVVHRETRSGQVYDLVAARGGPSAAPVSISTALQEQLGIQLRSTEGPVETIVIDHIERPSEN